MRTIKFRTLAAFVAMMVLVGGVVGFAQDNPVTFQSTQFNVVEEAELFRGILAEYDADVEFVGTEEGPLIDLLRAESVTGEGQTDLIGALHGTFPSLVADDILFDLSDLTADLDQRYNIADSFIELGRMGTVDYQYYVPWLQATYIMAANVEALEYLPDGVDLNAMTWDELAAWGVALAEGEGENKLGLPVAGLFHRFMQGYIYPSYTGGMVTGFMSPAAVEMFEYLRDDLWPYVNAESINYAFMNEPLLSGEVWVAFDHTARLLPAFDAMVTGDTDLEFVAFPAPYGPEGLGFMPVVVGLGVPFTAPNPDGAEELIEFLLSPETQAATLADLGFFPVVDGVDLSDLPESVAIEAEAVNLQANAENALPALLPVGLGERGGEFNELYRNVFSRIVFDGEDIETVLESEGAALNALLEDTGAPCWPPDPPSEDACQAE
jgi:multiple sugar transport system substrate-binding protein